MIGTKKLNFPKFLLNIITLFLIIVITSCASSYKRNADLVSLKNIVKLDGKYSVYISDNKLLNKLSLKSEDCESWQIDIEIDKAYKQSLKDILFSMFEDVQFTNKELSKEDLKNSGAVAQIVIKNHSAESIFVVERNTAKFNFILKTDVNVKSHFMTINNSVSTNKSWDNNIYLNCSANKGAYNSIQGALESIMSQIHNNIFSSVKSIKR
jgi:hypothetical protein